MRRRLPLLGLLLLAALPASSKTKRPPPSAPAVKGDLPGIEPSRLSSDATYDGQPSVAMGPDGRPWTAWVRYRDGKGDQVVARREGGDPEVLADGFGQYVRPVLAASGGSLWCFWTRSEPDRTASVWFSRRTASGWSAPDRLVPGEARAHQNVEAAAGPFGTLAAVYQVHNGTDYDIHLLRWDGERWAAPGALSGPGTSDWDPVVCFDALGGLHAVWSGFREGDYDLYWRREGREARRITARGDYDLHPCLAAAPDGPVWLVWDALRVSGHARSGLTTITGANLKDQDDSHGKKGAQAWVEARVLDGDAVRIPGDPRAQLRAPEGWSSGHGALPKVAVGAAGEPWVLYRTLKQYGRKDYHWDLVARPFRDGAWGEAVRFEASDGFLEEASAVRSPSGLRVAYAGEHREEQSKRHPAKDLFGEVKPDADEEADHHHDFDSEAGWKGDVYLAELGTGLGPQVPGLPVERALQDRDVQDRPTRDLGKYAVQRAGREWRLLWGDTHRHSNVSRCSQGKEPTPDDLYRYGTDVCLYDFLALSDHAEHPAPNQDAVIDQYWWRQQKLADLYHVPGFFSVLYNLEWSMLFPSGHHNTVFPGRPTLRLTRDLAGSSTLEGGWKALEKAGVRALTIPHTGADPKMGTDWGVQDDRYRRVCEIFQACRGSYEHSGCPREFKETSNALGFYWRALEKGHRIGIIASSDHGYGASYACVYAPENTREAAWQGMWDRRCYGSTAYGLVLDFRSGDRWMGEAWTSKEAPKLEVYVRGAAPVRSVEILGRSKVLFSRGSVERPIGEREVRLDWTDPDWAAQTKEQWYYVRVIQTDDEMAWSSPVWVAPAR